MTGSEPDSGNAPSGGPQALLRLVPNLLSGLRLVCAFVLPFSPPSWWLGLVLVAGASDWLDGYTARRLNSESWIGGLLDGVSDKAFVVSGLITFSLGGLLAWWQLPFLLLRDLCVCAGILVSAMRRDLDAFRQMDSRTFGKLATVVVFALFVALLQWPELEGLHGVLYSAAAILSAVAGGDYLLTGWRRVSQEHAQRD